MSKDKRNSNETRLTLGQRKRSALVFGILLSGLLFLCVRPTFGQRGCCSWHGGIAGCDRNVGRIVCNDGTYSPTCGCEKRNPFIEVDGKLTMPKGARVNDYGDGWICDRGFRQVGNTCVAVKVPAHASLDYTGHNWECDEGYKRLGDKCIPVHVPAHASLDYTGHNWECDKGYCRNGNECLPCK